MTSKRRWTLGLGLVGLFAVLFVVQAQVNASSSVQAAEAPRFEVDPFWPDPLPNNWVVGSVVGVWVDEQDYVWIIHRPASLSVTELGAAQDPAIASCCVAAPDVLAFNSDGELVYAWGGPGDGYDWPQSGHGISVDHLGKVWIGGNGLGDSHILAFSKDGEFIAQYGEPNARRGQDRADGQPTFVPNSHDRQSFGSPAKVFVDPETDEVYVADGYFNRRVAVVDQNTGEVTRYWGAYGNAPDDSYEYPPMGQGSPPAQQFRSPVHCADISNDGLVYVCDRAGNRLQVFNRDGTFVREAFIAPNTLASGSTWDVAFSRDPDQRYVYVADGQNMKVHILLRETLEVLTSFGTGGRQPGQFYGTHNVSTDSQGNLYTSETYEGKRVQKFVNMGVSDVGEDSGVPWPGR